MPAKTPSGKRLVETSLAILPTFVFIRAASTTAARDSQLRALIAAGRQSPSPFPTFTVFRHANRAPMVGDREIAGLREEEAREAALTQAMRDAESQAEARRIRLAEMKSASARRRAEAALAREQRAARRTERTDIAPGTDVEVIGAPAFAGAYGVLESVEGHYVNVRFGSHSWKIEGWQVMPASSAPRSLAA